MTRPRPDEAPRVSVLIPTFGRPAALARCLASLAAQAGPEPFEVVVVDDGGEPPADAGRARAILGEVPLCLLRTPHRGPAAARAAGLGQARGAIVALLDDDCSAPSGYLTAVTDAFARHPDLQVAQVGLDNPEPENFYGRAWKWLWEWTLARNVTPEPASFQRCDLLGGVMVARRAVFGVVGYDGSFPGAREDADLHRQLARRGIPVGYLHEVRVFHHCRRTMREYLAQQFAYGRGELHLRRKWTGSPSPVRRPSPTSWRALQALVRAEGPADGLRLWALFWVRRHVGVGGMLYEAATEARPERGPGRVLRFAGLWACHYVRHAAALARAGARRAGSALGRRAPP